MDNFSFLNAIDSNYLEDVYNRYLQNPDAVEPSWRAFFQGFDFAIENGAISEIGAGVTVESKGKTIEVSETIVKEFQVIKLINGYRSRGHLFTKTNPVRERRHYEPSLAIDNFGLTNTDLEVVFQAGEIIGLPASKLKDIISRLEDIYCHSIGVEYMYIRKPEEVIWIQNKLNDHGNQTVFTPKQKKHILKKLNQAVGFENFLHTKYVGQKRFSLEGVDALIPTVDAIVEKAADLGVESFVMGIAHRGRLNVLTNIFGKSAKDIFSEFEGKDYDVLGFDGDVKYHMGWTSDRLTDNQKKININIAPNPSHLETVGVVVEGIARAKQEKYFSEDYSKVLPIVVHGDAAIAGQGLVYEMIQMAKLEGYKTNGTIHIVTNNQIGFTTNYTEGRSSTYCTDVAKVTLSPVLHVNADDVEAVIHATLFALDFRMTFKRDVFIDLLGYRKYGHNEGDEPKFTQPKLYKAIAKHDNPRDIYAARLISEGVIDQQYVKQLEDEYKQQLEKDLESSKKEEATSVTPFMQNEWTDFVRVKKDVMLQEVDTTYPLEKLTALAEKLTTLPEGKKFIKKITRLIDARRKMFFEDNRLDWASGELLAYATLLEEGYDVRISGQDVERGTFSHRHAVIRVEDSEEKITLLSDIAGQNNTHFNIYNSFLSEYGVLGFDYGYAMAKPKALTIWEAQFGDFSNGAQIVIDQYISAGEDKWKTQNGIVLLLPHGFEGQGAEHSSARMERYLQLCAKDNMFVADCTTPANFFHLLRRQMKVNYRKPLVVFTPKSLLRHPKVVSTKEELSTGTFLPVIDDATAMTKDIKTLVFCTGKFYYDLHAARETSNRTDVALVRLEQLFPLPEAQLDAILDKYKQTEDIVWAQEEPKNMGAWSHLMMHYESASKFRVASRRFYASPASGSSTRDKKRQQEVIDYVFDKSKNNNLKIK